MDKRKGKTTNDCKVTPPPSTLDSKRRTKSLGFTLIELAVSLVVIGLIAGGILTGSSMIESAKIRAQISQKEQLVAAANTFKTKYDAYPGDISPTNAGQLGFFTFTGAYAGSAYLYNDGNVATLGYAKFGFGNNNGEIEQGEHYVFWRHLSDAKMINGQYGAAANPSGLNIASGSSPVPAIFLGSISYSSIAQLDYFLPQSQFLHKDNHIRIGNNRYWTKAAFFTSSPLTNLLYFYTTPYQESAIDTKIDDGIPDKGTVRDFGTSNGSSGIAPCVTAATPNAYDLKTNPNITDTCSIVFLW